MDNTPIPSDFRQKPDSSFISECIACKRDVVQENLSYLLEKAVNNFPSIDARETIFEYAICLDCAFKAQQKLSEESRKSIEDLFQSESVRNNSIEIFLKASEEDKPTHHYCILTGRELKDCEEYQIYAYCQGPHLRQNSQPFMLSGEALEIIQELLSTETRDELDNFKNENFGLPPELEKILNRGDLIFL